MGAYSYNMKSMNKYSWDPRDLGLPLGANSGEVYNAVVDLQRGDPALKVDGFVGPATVRRILAFRTIRLDDEAPNNLGFLLIKGKPVPVPFRARLATPAGDMSLIQFDDYDIRTNTPTQVVWHWDVTFSAKVCRRILSKRGYSSHGCIDNDGVFYQFLDFASHAGWHAGKRAVNNASIGIDVCNVVTYSKKNERWYKKRFGPRPIISATTNGRKHKKFFGYYPVQVETAKEIVQFLHCHMGIELAVPTTNDMFDSPEDFRGHIGHFHITDNKWDPSGFPFDYITGGGVN